MSSTTNRKYITPADLPAERPTPAAAAVDGAPTVPTQIVAQSDPLDGPLPVARRQRSGSGAPSPVSSTARLVVRQEGQAGQSVKTIEVVGTVTYLDADTAQITASGGGDGGNLYWPINGEAAMIAWEAMTLEIAYSDLNGGSVAWTINGSGASSPFALAAGDELSGVLSGATGRGIVALQRTA